MKDLIDPFESIFPFEQQAEVRPAPGYRIPLKKPRAVVANAARADAMIGRLAAGDRAGALALLTDVERAHRTQAIEKELSADAFARELRKAELPFQAPRRVVLNGKEVVEHPGDGGGEAEPDAVLRERIRKLLG